MFCSVFIFCFPLWYLLFLRCNLQYNMELVTECPSACVCLDGDWEPSCPPGDPLAPLLTQHQPPGLTSLLASVVCDAFSPLWFVVSVSYWRSEVIRTFFCIFMWKLYSPAFPVWIQSISQKLTLSCGAQQGLSFVPSVAIGCPSIENTSLLPVTVQGHLA